MDVSRCDDKWHLTVKNLKDSRSEEYNFDGVMVCIGHFAKPFIPNITGLDTFKGHLIHSQRYRRNEIYKGKRLLIVGAAASGRDICIECAEVAEEVIVSYGSKEMKCSLGENCKVKPRLTSVKGEEAFFVDGTSVTVDAIIFCTGYRYDFPFLDDSCGIEVEDGQIVKPLFKHFINIKYPSMCFIGLLQKTIIFPLMDLQAHVFVKILTNQINVPSTSTMFQDLDEENIEKSRKNIPKAHYYYLGDKMRSYILDLAKFGKVNPPPPVIFNIYTENQRILLEDYKKLKHQMFTIIDDNTYELYSSENK